jgi:hypothetical protein
MMAARLGVAWGSVAAFLVPEPGFSSREASFRVSARARRPSTAPAPDGRTGPAGAGQDGADGMMAARLGVAWGSVAAFLVLGSGWLADDRQRQDQRAVGLAEAVGEFLGLVHHPERRPQDDAEQPYGTLILTLSIVIIEVALVAAVMLGAKAAPTLGRPRTTTTG